jgi:hypothetical protein
MQPPLNATAIPAGICCCCLLGKLVPSQVDRTMSTKGSKRGKHGPALVIEAWHVAMALPW